jgi:hypothetical protein
VVSEPDSAEGDCEEVGVAFVNVRDILKNQRDVREQDIPSELICFNNYLFGKIFFKFKN